MHLRRLALIALPAALTLGTLGIAAPAHAATPTGVVVNRHCSNTSLGNLQLQREDTGKISVDFGVDMARHTAGVTWKVKETRNGVVFVNRSTRTITRRVVQHLEPARTEIRQPHRRHRNQPEDRRNLHDQGNPLTRPRHTQPRRKGPATTKQVAGPIRRAEPRADHRQRSAGPSRRTAPISRHSRPEGVSQLCWDTRHHVVVRNNGGRFRTADLLLVKYARDGSRRSTADEYGWSARPRERQRTGTDDSDRAKSAR